MESFFAKRTQSGSLSDAKFFGEVERIIEKSPTIRVANWELVAPGDGEDLAKLVKWLGKQAQILKVEESSSSTQNIVDTYLWQKREEAASRIYLGVSQETLKVKRLYISAYWIPSSTFGEDFRRAFEARKWKLASSQPVEEEVSVAFAFPAVNGVECQYRTYPLEELDSIAENYSPDVIAAARSLVQKLKENHQGLVILHGPPGTGKTHLIKALLTELRHERRALICLPSLTFLTNAGLLTRAVSTFDRSLVVFEDLGDVLAVDSSVNHADINANLLNLTDGLLSLLSNSIFLLSFNVDIGKINPAVTRPGRCLANIEVGMLDNTQASKLVGQELPVGKYSLAEVYQFRREAGLLPKPTKLIGFRTTTKLRIGSEEPSQQEGHSR